VNNHQQQKVKIEYDGPGDSEAASDSSSEPFVGETRHSSLGVEINDSSVNSNSPYFEEGSESSTTNTKWGEFSFQSRPFLDNPKDPLSEMFLILRGLAYEQIKPYVQKIPESMVESVGLSAIALLGFNQIVGRRRRSSFGSTFRSLVLSGIATGAISTVIAKHMLLDENKPSFNNICRTIVTRAWDRIKIKAMNRDNWRSTLAMIVLLVLGKRRSS
jgi:hypothetical protein